MYQNDPGFTPRPPPVRPPNMSSNDAPSFLQVSVQPNVRYHRGKDVISRSVNRRVWNQSSRIHLPDGFKRSTAALTARPRPGPRRQKESQQISHNPQQIADGKKYLRRTVTEVTVPNPMRNYNHKYLSCKQEKIPRDPIKKRGHTFLRRKKHITIDPNHRGASVLGEYGKGPKYKPFEQSMAVQSARAYRNKRDRDQIYNPWGKDGAGAPLHNGNGEVQAQLHVINQPRQAELEKQGYNPWGKAGGGAPIRNAQGGIEAEVYKVAQAQQMAHENSAVYKNQPWGHAGGGAPLRNADGQIETQLHKINQARDAARDARATGIFKGGQGGGAALRDKDGNVQAEVYKILQQRHIPEWGESREGQRGVYRGGQGGGAPLRNDQGNIEAEVHKILQKRVAPEPKKESRKPVREPGFQQRARQAATNNQ